MSSDGARGARWDGAPERLDRILPALGLTRSRSRAAERVQAGDVTVDGAPATKPGQRVRTGAEVRVAAVDHYVSRGAHKLLAALDTFDVAPQDATALDVGASTGGFTQVLLERGAAVVQAVDVGRDQLAPELRDEPRVRLFEGCNARDLTADLLAERTGVRAAPDLIVADLSFISLALILPAIARVAAPDADAILLVKPQFEVGRVKDGVVTDPAQHAEAIRIALRAASDVGFGARGIIPSPIAGGAGNREFLVHFTRTAAADPTEWEERIALLTGISPGTGALRGRENGGT